MRVSFGEMLRILLVTFVAGAGLGAPAFVSAQEAPGVTGPNAYESPTFGYEVAWSDDWAVVARATMSEQDRDLLTLDNSSEMRVQVVGVDPSTELDALLDSMIAPILEGELFEETEVTELESEAGELAVNLDFKIGEEPSRQRIEARLLPSGDAVIGVRLSTQANLFESAFADATENVLIDGEPFFANQSGVTSESDADGPGGGDRDGEEQDNAQDDRSQDDEIDEDAETPPGDDGPASDGATFDIAAMTYLPEAVEDEGWVVFGGDNAATVSDVAELAADARGGDDATAAEYEDMLEEWGWQRNYMLQYVQVESLSDAGYGVVLQVIVDQWEDESGAEQSFEFFSDTEVITAYDAVPEETSDTFGDESYANSFSGAAETGEEFEGAEITFRIGNLGATVAIIAYDGDRPRVGDIEPLAAALQERMESVLDDGSTTLGLAAISVEGEAVAFRSEHYLRLDGETIAIAGEPADSVAMRDDGYGNADAVYAAYRQVTAGGEGFEDDANVNLWLYRFGSERRAGNWFDDLSESLQLEENVAPDLGEASVGYPTEVDRGEAGVATGFVVYVLVGTDVALIDAQAVGGVEMATVENLVEEQVACLEQGACDEVIPVPEALTTGAPDADGDDDEDADEGDDPAEDGPAVGGPTDGDDVANFRGNLARTGVLPGPAPGDDPSIDWFFEMGDSTYASAAVVDGVVYITSNDGNLYALDAESGDEVWTFDAGDGQLSPPAVADGIVYFGSESGFVYAVDAASGDGVWEYEAGDYVYASPAVIDGNLYAGFGAGLLALDAQSGEELWTLDLGDGQAFREVAVVDGVIYGAGDNIAVAVDAESGEPIWQQELSDEVETSPAVAGDIVYLPCEDGTLFALDVASGDEVWSVTTNEDGDALQAVGVADGIVVVVDENESAYGFDAISGDPDWTYSSDAGFEYTSPVIVDGSVYLAGEDGAVYELDLESGEEIRRIEVGSWLTGDVVVVGGTIYVSEESGTIYAVR